MDVQRYLRMKMLVEGFDQLSNMALSSPAGPTTDAQHQQEDQRVSEGDVRHVGQGLGEAASAAGPAVVVEGARRPLALLGHQGVQPHGAHRAVRAVPSECYTHIVEHAAFTLLDYS